MLILTVKSMPMSIGTMSGDRGSEQSFALLGPTRKNVDMLTPSSYIQMQMKRMISISLRLRSGSGILQN